MQNSPAARQAVVVGAGFAGAVTARELADHGYQVKILERRAQIGGNMYDYPRDGVLTHLYGPHIFHTGNQKVFEYLSRFTRWVPYEHRVLGRIKGKYVPIPFNFRSMEELFPSEEAAMLREKLTAAYPGQDRVSVLDLVHNPDPDIARLGEFVFENVFVHYTAKQWGMPAEQVDTSVINRVPVVLGYDDRYFRDPIQMMPEQGFTPLFEAMLDHENITVELDTDARSRLTLTEDGRILLDGEAFAQLGNGKILFNTSIGPGHDVKALERWLNAGGNTFVCDTVGALGDPALAENPAVICPGVSAGRTAQAFELLSKKVLDNVRTFLGTQ